ncbi:MAG TPA: hypothetical protein VG476_12055 [Acidimicrobiales bacterium]|nr:hypothetical protein [Acidimicrobiales bacterium]
MAVIEVQNFRLAHGVEAAEFLDADKRLQTELMLRKPTFLRRTTARGADGDWLVIVLWASQADADTSNAQFDRHPARVDFTALVDEATVTWRRYETLD